LLTLQPFATPEIIRAMADKERSRLTAEAQHTQGKEDESDILVVDTDDVLSRRDRAVERRGSSRLETKVVRTG
jgi:hypothetical protein